VSIVRLFELPVMLRQFEYSSFRTFQLPVAPFFFFLAVLFAIKAIPAQNAGKRFSRLDETLFYGKILLVTTVKPTRFVPPKLTLFKYSGVGVLDHTLAGTAFVRTF